MKKSFPIHGSMHRRFLATVAVALSIGCTTSVFAVDVNGFDPVGDMAKQAGGGGDKKGGGEDAGAAVKQMLTHMDAAEKSLKQKDLGQLTQASQKGVIQDLDALIEIVRKQNEQPPPPPKPKPGEGPPKKGPPGPPAPGKGKGPPKPGSQAAQDDQIPQGAAEEPAKGGDIHEGKSQEWGNLPPRDRDLISNGSQEKYLPTYKDAIDRYYQSLAEMSKKQSN